MRSMFHLLTRQDHHPSSSFKTSPSTLMIKSRAMELLHCFLNAWQVVAPHSQQVGTIVHGEGFSRRLPTVPAMSELHSTVERQSTTKAAPSSPPIVPRARNISTQRPLLTLQEGCASAAQARHQQGNIIGAAHATTSTLPPLPATLAGRSIKDSSMQSRCHRSVPASAGGPHGCSN